MAEEGARRFRARGARQRVNQGSRRPLARALVERRRNGCARLVFLAVHVRHCRGAASSSRLGGGGGLLLPVELVDRRRRGRVRALWPARPRSHSVGVGLHDCGVVGSGAHDSLRTRARLLVRSREFPQALVAYAVFALVLPKRFESWKSLAVLWSVRLLFAGDDVIERTHRDAVDFDSALPGDLESFDAVRSKHDVDVEGTVSELDEVLSGFRFRLCPAG